MATLEQRGESWRVYWRRGGRGGRKESTTWPRSSLAARAKRIAEAHGHAITADQVYEAILGAAEPVDQVGPTFAAWSKTWIESLVPGRDLSQGTWDDYERIVRLHLVPRLGTKRLEDIDADTIRTWAAAMSAYRAARTVRKAHAVLHQVLGAAVPKHIPSNPADHQGGRRGQRGLPTVETDEMSILEPAQARRLIKTAPDAIRDLLVVVLATGLRLGEIIALQCGDVTRSKRGGTERMTVWIRRAVKHDGTIGPPKSKAGRRAIMVTGEAVHVLDRLTKKRSPRAWLFMTPRGCRWNKNNFRNRYWDRAVAAAMRCPAHPPEPLKRRAKTGPAPVDPLAVSTCDCPERLHQALRFHDLRHTHASMLIAAGWDALALKTRMGHADIRTTYDIYGHLLDHGQDAKLDALGELLAEGGIDAEEESADPGPSASS